MGVKSETSFSVNVPSMDRVSSVIEESQQITFTWSNINVQVEGTEARSGFCGIGARDAKSSKTILQDGKVCIIKIQIFNKLLRDLFLSEWILSPRRSLGNHGCLWSRKIHPFERFNLQELIRTFGHIWGAIRQWCGSQSQLAHSSFWLCPAR